MCKFKKHKIFIFIVLLSALNLASGQQCLGAANGRKCENGGIATGTTQNCSCLCPDHFSGENCEISMSSDICTMGSQGRACQNGGIVQGTTGNCSCKCPQGYSGDNCETAMHCTKGPGSLPCLNGGEPQGTGSDCICNCIGMFTGDQCEQVIQTECPICYNNATLTGSLKDNNCACKCQPKFSGISCSQDDSCNEEFSSLVCENGGTSQGKFSNCHCLCVQGFFGVNCENIATVVEDEKYTEIEENKEYENEQLLNEPINWFYKFKLTTKDPYNFFSVLTQDLDQNSDADIYISKQPFPGKDWNDTTFDSENTQACVDYGFDNCLLSGNDIQKLNDYVYFALRCYDSCHYNFQVSYTYPQSIKFGDYITYFGQSDKAVEVFQFDIPETAFGLTIKHILLNFNLLNSYDQELTFDLKVIANSKGFNADEVYSLTPATNWNSGKTFTIFEDDAVFCTNCSIMVSLISLSKDAMFEIDYEAYDTSRNLVLYETLYDAVKWDGTLILRLDAVGDHNYNVSNQSLNIDIKEFHGKVSIRIRGETKTGEEDVWKKTYSYIDGADSINLSPDDMTDIVGEDPRIFYLEISSYVSSTFSILAYYQNQTSFLIYDGLSMYGTVNQGEFKTYNYYNFDNRENVNITVSLNAFSGNPELFVKFCKVDPKNCTLEQADVDLIFQDTSNTSIISNNDFDLWWSLNPGLDSDLIIIKQQNQMCSNIMEELSFCTYNFFVVGNAEDFVQSNVSDFTSTYNIYVSKDDTYISLVEGEALTQQIAQEQKQYYHFKIEDDKNMKSVTFQTTTIVGRVEVFASRIEKNPIEDNYYQASWSGKYPIVYESSPEGSTENVSLAGDYWISVLGNDVSTYTIIVTTEIVIPSDETMEENYYSSIKLNPGTPQHILQYDDSPQYFTFDTDLKDDVTTMYIILTSIKGSFEILVNTDITKLPVFGDSDIYSFNDTVEITKGNEFFQQKGSYVIGVRPIIFFFDEFESDNSYEYNILVDTNIEIQVQENFANQYSISAQTYKFFRVNIDKDSQNSIIISINDDLYNSTQIFVSLKGEQNRPTSEEGKNDNALAIVGDHFISISPTLYGNICYESQPVCTLYFSVFNQNSESVQFTLLVAEDKKDKLLQDGIPYVLQSPWKSEVQLMQYFISNNHSIDISITTGYVPLKVSLGLSAQDFNSKNTTNQTLANIAPTDKTRLFQSINNSVQYYSFYQRVVSFDQINKVCVEGLTSCSLIIKIESEPAFQPTPEDETYVQKDSYEIFITADVMKIDMGKQYPNTVQQDAYQYYMFYYPHEIAQSSIHIQTTAYGTGAVLTVVKYYPQYDGQFPSKIDNDWSSSTEYTGEIAISEATSRFPMGTLQGYYVIGVNGLETTSYTLVVTENDQQLIEVFGGKPLQLHMNKKRKVYLKYYNYEKQNLMLQMNIDGGYGFMSAKVHKFGEDPKEIYQESTPDWSQKTSKYFNQIRILETDQANCDQCFIIIKFDVKGSLSCTFVLKEQGMPVDLVFGKPFRDYIIDGMPNYYRLTFNDAIGFNIMLQRFLKYTDDLDIQITYPAGDGKVTQTMNLSSSDSENYIDTSFEQKQLEAAFLNAEYQINGFTVNLVVSSPSEFYGYIIQAYQNDGKSLYLGNGQERWQNIKVNEVQKFRFTAFKSENPDNSFVVQIKQRDSFQYPLLNIQINQIIKSPQSDGNVKETKISPQVVSKSYGINTLIEISFTQNSLYEIEISKQKALPEQPLYYSISINPEGIVQSSLNYDIYDQIPIDMYKFYAIESQKSSTTIFQVSPCQGTFLLYETTNIEAIQLKTFEKKDGIESRSDQNSQIISPSKFNGVIYFGIKGLSGTAIDSENVQGAKYKARMIDINAKCTISPLFLVIQFKI